MCVPGSLYFRIYENDINRHVRLRAYHLFDDDALVYCSGNTT